MSIHAEQHLQALPPWVQEQREVDAIHRDPRLREWIGEDPILEIHKVYGEDGPCYILITERGGVQVDVRYLRSKQHICGPARFELIFHEISDTCFL